MEIRFDNKVALITGGTSGIGLACAELMGSLGAKVAVCGTNPAKLEKAVAELREKVITAYGGPAGLCRPHPGGAGPH